MSYLFNEEKRRKDPQPVVTDDRKPVVVGLAAWLVTLVVLVVFFRSLLTGWVFWTIIVGIALGILGLVYTFVRHRKV